MNSSVKTITGCLQLIWSLRPRRFWRVMCCLCCLCLLSHTESWSAETSTVVVPAWGFTSNSYDTYFTQLLSLAFAKTADTEGHLSIKVFSADMSNARVMADLKNNINYDVAWNGLNTEREQDLIPIRISLLKELSEYRVLMIRKEDQEKFSAVKSIDDLRQFTAGSGATWTSTQILKKNNLPVVAVNRARVLFPMLKAKRFDYISRNMFEAWEEEELFKDEGFVIERTLLLHSGVPYYFFVSKEKKALAERIERGLKLAIADGSFDELFFSTPGFKRGSEEIKAGKRRLIELNKIN
jgi:Bacterial extracellular solute-binding proteins, family 3